MSAMTCTCGRRVENVRPFLGHCSSACLDAEVFWQQIKEPLRQLLTPLCLRCVKDEPAPDDHLCGSCRDEVSSDLENARQDAAQHALGGDERDTL